MITGTVQADPVVLPNGAIPANEQGCRPPASMTPEVLVTSTRGEPQFSYDQNSGDLGQKAAGNSYKPNGVGGPAWHTGGLTKNNIKITPSVKSHTLTMTDHSIACTYIEGVHLDVQLSPVVWVANEFPQGSCMYNAVKEHEMKHVNADRIVLNQHLARLHAALNDAVEGRAFFGPAAPAAVESAVGTFVGQLQETMEREINSFYADELKAQHAIDTIQEYNRISHLCPQQLKDIGQ